MTAAQAFWRGVLTTLVLVVPAAILNEWLVAGEDPGSTTPLAMIMWVLILLGAGSGGWATIRLCPSASLAFPSGAAALAYAIVQGAGIVRRVIAGESNSWIAYPFLMLLMATCGMLGGMFARRWLQQGKAAG